MTDLAPELLDWLDEQLRPGREWSTRDERTWTRWPYRYRQQVQAGPSALDRDVPTTRAVATTPLVTNVVDADLALEMAVAANRVASLSAVVVDEVAGRVALASAASLRQANRVWLLPVFGEVLKLQIAVPERGDPDVLAEGFGGVADLAPHPLSGRRPEPHAELKVVEAYQRAGLEPLRIPVGTFGATVGDLHAMSIPSVADGATLAVGAETLNLGGPARITVQSATHPGFGNGLLSVLRPAAPVVSTSPARVVNELNRRELWERLDGQTFGAWSIDDAGVGHLVFYPNRLLPVGEGERRSRLVNCVLDEVRRLAWLDRVWNEVAAGDAAAGDATARDAAAERPAE